MAALLERIARALERLAPPSPRKPDFDKAEAFIWQAEPEAFLPVAKRQPRAARPAQGHRPHARHAFRKHCALRAGLPANNALLWGARGMGKSSLVKAVHAAVSREAKPGGRAEARRDPPRGHRARCPAAGASSATPRASASSCSATTCPSRRRRHLLQIAESGARRRHRRAARTT